MDLKNLFKNILNKKKPFKKGSFVINPDLYWKSILLLFSLIIVGFFVFGFFLFKKVNFESSAVEATNVIKLKTVNKEKLDEIIEYFAKRDKVSSSIINLPSPVVDPSL